MGRGRRRTSVWRVAGEGRGKNCLREKAAVPKLIVMAFAEIRILDLDVERTEQSPSAPGLRLMHLELSADPPSEWAQIFDNERSFARHSMWREARIEGRYIVVDCVPEELQRYHLPDLKQDVGNSNVKYVAWLARHEADEAREAEQKKAELERLRKVKEGLKFD